MHPTKSKYREKPRVFFLDYLRVFAFISVVIGHKFYTHLYNFAYNDTIAISPQFLLKLLLPFFHGGGAGVVVFFLVSGYIITHVLQVQHPTVFFINRIFRIYPLYIVAVLLQAWVDYANKGVSPELSNLIPQLLLIGDFFKTPYTLSGVEWTLRVEILFYFFMGILRVFNLFNRYPKALPCIFVSVILFLGILCPFPSFDYGSQGFLTIYSPFLFLGSICYLKEKNIISFSFFIGFIILVLSQYYILITIYHPYWSRSHFVIFALIIFFSLWHHRTKIKAPPYILFLSDLTYSVYLFHNWAWAYIGKALDRFSISFIHSNVQIIFVLFTFCFLMVILIEKPGVRLGKKLSQRIQQRTIY